MKRIAGLASVIACAALIVAPGVGAFAADIPLKARAPAQVTAASWSGFFAGAHGGFGWDPAEANFDPGGYGTTLVPGIVIDASTGPLNLKVHPTGGYGGILIGFNQQTGATVWGWVADVSYGKIKGETVRSFAVDANVGGDDASYSGSVRLRQHVDVFGTIRARYGWLQQAMLVFVTGGFAWGHVRTNFDVFNVTAASGAGGDVQAILQAGASASANRLQVGFAAGAGFEWAFVPGWTMGIEYLFVDLLTGNTLVIPGGTAKTDFWMHTVRFNLTTRFGAP
jgi:outer membrane immunogenic protein